MKPKVAIIIERADTALGGAERSVFEIAQALSVLGIEVHILAAKGDSEAKNVHILCSELPGKRTGLKVFERELRRHLEQNHYDIVHSVLPFDFANIYQPRGGTYAESIARNAATYTSRVVRTFKKLSAFANINRTGLLRAERRLARNAQGPRIVAISQYVARQFQQHYGTDSRRITIIPNGVRIDWTTDKAETENLRRHIFGMLGIKQAGSSWRRQERIYIANRGAEPEPDEPVLFLFAGNDFRRKGLACLIRALRLLTSQAPKSPACLVIAGHRKISRYRRLSTKLNVAERIVFLDKLSHIHSVLDIADVAVLPTFQDACSRFILEALSVGKPVITTRFNGAVDFFSDNRHGRVIERPDDIAALADALAYFTEAANIQKASQAIIEDNIKQQVSISRVAEQLKALYDDILQMRR